MKKTDNKVKEYIERAREVEKEVFKAAQDTFSDYTNNVLQIAALLQKEEHATAQGFLSNKNTQPTPNITSDTKKPSRGMYDNSGTPLGVELGSFKKLYCKEHKFNEDLACKTCNDYFTHNHKMAKKQEMLQKVTEEVYGTKEAVGGAEEGMKGGIGVKALEDVLSKTTKLIYKPKQN